MRGSWAMAALMGRGYVAFRGVMTREAFGSGDCGVVRVLVVGAAGGFRTLGS